MRSIILFLLLSIPVFLLSLKVLLKPGHHGFYRFLSWEAILILIVTNNAYWFRDPLSLVQIISWIFLILSLYLVFAGVFKLHKHGKPGTERDDRTLYSFEKTGRLVDTGIYKYIRHPMYSSLLFLGWGIFLKKPELILLIPSCLSCVFLYIAARLDERECILFFGDEYRKYMKRTKMFIPLLF